MEYNEIYVVCETSIALQVMSAFCLTILVLLLCFDLFFHGGLSREPRDSVAVRWRNQISCKRLVGLRQYCTGGFLVSQMLHGAGIFTYIWVIFVISVGKCFIHGSYEYGGM